MQFVIVVTFDERVVASVIQLVDAISWVLRAVLGA